MAARNAKEGKETTNEIGGHRRGADEAAGIGARRDNIIGERTTEDPSLDSLSSIIHRPDDDTEPRPDPLFSPEGHAQLRIEIAGIPEPQGNAKVRGVRGGKAWVQTKTPALVDWRQAIRTEAQAAMRAAGYDVFLKPKWAIDLGITFYFAKPKSTPKYIKHMTVIPDIDKLARAVLDGLSGVVYQDDGQVFCVSAEKVYGQKFLGAVVDVRAIPEKKPRRMKAW